MKRFSQIFFSAEFLVWLLAAAVVIFLPLFMATHDHGKTLRALVQRGRTTKGGFVEKKDHGQITYFFVVQNRRYYGTDESPMNAEAGAPFDVFYDPVNPLNNTTQEPNHELEINSYSWVFPSIWFSAMLAVFVRAVGKLVRASLAQTWTFSPHP